MEVPEGDYLVFEHGPFDLQTENSLVEAKIERAMRDFDYEAAGCCLDTAPGRVFYFVHVVCVSGSISGLLFDFKKTVEILSRW